MMKWVIDTSTKTATSDCKQFQITKFYGKYVLYGATELTDDFGEKTECYCRYYGCGTYYEMCTLAKEIYLRKKIEEM